MEPRLDEFTRAYIECALWAETAHHPDNPERDVSFDSAGYGVDDIAPETLAQMIVDCEDFQESNYDDLEVYIDSYPMDYAGCDFFLTRNRHGAGFWDRGLGALGERLSANARAYGELTLYLGDDDLIYSS